MLGCIVLTKNAGSYKVYWARNERNDAKKSTSQPQPLEPKHIHLLTEV